MPTFNRPYIAANQFDTVADVYSSPRVGLFRFKPYYDFTAEEWKNQLDEMTQHGPYFIRVHGTIGIGDDSKTVFYFDEAGPAGERLMQEANDPIEETIMVWVQDPANEWSWEVLGNVTYGKDGERKKITLSSAPAAGKVVMISFYTKDYVLV